MPFWLQRGSVRESGAALPGAAVSATATLAILVYEPGRAWPIFRAVAPDLLGHPAWLALLSLAAPLATLLVLRSQRQPTPGGWTAFLPICGLFVLAKAAAGAVAAGRERRPAPPLPAARLHRLQTWPRRRPTLPAPATWGPFRAGLPWQSLLFASHLGWLCGAAAWLAYRADPVGSLGGFAALHLLTMASAHLMMQHERRRRALLPLGWANRLVPCLLLAPAPAHLLAVVCWTLPRARQAPSPAAFAFSAQSPLQRLAVFRSVLPARSGLSTFFETWTAGDPFAHVAAARRRRERPWIALHRFAFALQCMAAARFLMPLGGSAEALLLQALHLALLGAAALYCLQLALVLAGFREPSSPLLTRLGRGTGFAVALALGLAAGSVLAGPSPALGQLVPLLLVAGSAMLLGLPVEVLSAAERLDRLPVAVTRGLAFVAAAISLQLLCGFLEPGEIETGLDWALVGSPMLSPLLVQLARKTSAPASMSSGWLGIPGAASALAIRFGQSRYAASSHRSRPRP